MEEKYYYHCANKGFESDVLFASQEEFIAGMNRIAICLAILNWKVVAIAFCLMDNHVHFLLYGTESDCIEFMNLYKKLSEMWLSAHRPDSVSKRKWIIDVWPQYNREVVKDRIVYIHRNPLCAGMKYAPSGYRWSSANLIFSDNDWITSKMKKIGSLSKSKQRIILKTNTCLPEEWLINEEGLIWPGCYVRYQKIESLFSSVKDYIYHLNKNVEEELNKQDYLSSFSKPDSEILSIIQTISKEIFNQSDIYSLGTGQKIELCQRYRKQLGTNYKQLARILQLKVGDLKQIFG